MQELVYQHGIHSCLNANIEVIRDAAEVIGIREMVNAYQSMSWGITEGGRLVVMITDKRYRHEHNMSSSADKHVIVEFQGDGCLKIWACDTYGKPIDENDYYLFDTHWYLSDKSAHESFVCILKKRYDVVY